VGPVCETGDFFARDRELPVVSEGDLLAILDTGAYGMVLSSNYNTRSRPAEILVRGKSAKVIRRRETVADLLRLERYAWRSPHFNLLRKTWKKSVPVRNRFTSCCERRQMTRSPSHKSRPG